MKTIKKQARLITLLLVLLIVFQSCVVYEKSSVSLEYAAKQERKAKVKAINNQTYKFKRIEYENDQFYGIRKINREIIKIPLESNEITKVQLQNKGLSNVASVATILGSLITVLLGWYLIDTGGGNWLDLSE